MGIDLILFTLISSTIFFIAVKNIISGKISFIDLFVVGSTFYLNIGIVYVQVAGLLYIPEKLIWSLFLSQSILFLWMKIFNNKSKNSLKTITCFSNHSFKRHLIFLNICVIFLMLYYFYINGIPIFKNDVESARVAAFNNSKNLYYVFLVIAPIQFIYNYFFSKKNIYILFFLIMIFLGFLTGFRALIFNYILVFLLCIFWGKQGLKKRYIVFTVFLSATIGILLTYLRLPESHRSFSFAVDVLIQRLFVVNVFNLVNIFRYFEGIEFLYGKTIIWDVPYIRRSFVYLNIIEHSDTFAIWMTSKLNPFFSRDFIMTPTLFGIAYANFGIIGPSVWVIILLIFEKIIKKIQKYHFFFPFYVFSISLAIPIFTRGFFSVLSLMFIPGLLFSIFFIRGIYKIYNSRI